MLEEVITKISGAFVDTLPQHKAGLSIEHNPHKNIYESVEKYVGDDDASWVSEIEKQKAFETDELWELQWYPDGPVGFCLIRGASLQSVMVAMYVSEVERILDEDESKPKIITPELIKPQADKPKLILP